MLSELIRGLRSLGPGLSVALILSVGPLAGCGGAGDGTVMDAQDEELVEAENAMLQYSEQQGQGPPP